MNDVQCWECGTSFYYFLFNVMNFELSNIVIKNVNTLEKAADEIDPNAPIGDPSIFQVNIKEMGDSLDKPELYGILIKNITTNKLNGGKGALLQASFERFNSSLTVEGSTFESI